MQSSYSPLVLLSFSTLFCLTCAACTDDDNNETSDVDMASVGSDMASDDMQPVLDMGDVEGEDMTPAQDMAPEQDTAPDADAGNPDEDMGAAEPLELLGQWASVFGTEEITEEMWGFYTLVDHDNEQNVAITRNTDDGTDFALKYNRIVWTEPATDGSFYYCTTDFGKETLEDAKTDPTEVDDSMPDVMGCGGFPWTRLVPNEVIEITGSYVSNFGGMETITSESWDFGYLLAAMIMFNNASNVAITQNPDGEPDTFPNTFSRVVWTEPGADGSFYYCTTDFNKMTAEEAMMMPTMADDTDPENSGCGGFPWTKLDVMP